MAPFLPIFVYGTLRSDRSNAERLAHARRIERAVAFGIALYDLGRDPWPYASLSSSSTDVTHGELVWLTPEDYAPTLAQLDEYEDVNPDHPEQGDYVRTAYPVSALDGTVHQAWMYLASSATQGRLTVNCHIVSGVWSPPG